MKGGGRAGMESGAPKSLKRLPKAERHHAVMPRKSAAELKKQRRADRWGLGSADTPPVDGAPTPAELTNQWVEAHYNDKAPLMSERTVKADHLDMWAQP